MVGKYFSGGVIVKNLSSAVDSPSTYEKCMFLGFSILDSDLTGLRHWDTLLKSMPNIS